MSDVISIPRQHHQLVLDEVGKDILSKIVRHGEPPASRGVPAPERTIHVQASAAGGDRPDRAETSGSLIVERDASGVVVSDPLGAAYGCGATYAEAFTEWEELAREAFDELRQEVDRLHPRLLGQFAYLQRFFG